MGDLTPSLLQLFGRRHLCEALAEALLTEFEVLGLIIQCLDLGGLLLVVGLQVTHLPDTPAANGHASGPQQQRDNGQPVTATRRYRCRRFHR